MNTSRYNRQMLLDNFGAAVQEKLHNASVLVIGAGGLGCPVLIQLATMGVGRIGIVDDDAVSLQNLHRQHLFTEDSVGCYKCDVAKNKLLAHNSEVNIETYPIRLTAKESLALFPLYDIIVDGTDNFETRYMINDACVLLNKPLVYGAVFQFEGQVAAFNLLNQGVRTANYRDLFPQIPNSQEVPTCNEVGAFGILTSTIGNYMAQIIFSIISGMGSNVSNRLLIVNLLHFNTEIYQYDRRVMQQEFPIDTQSFLTFPYHDCCHIDREKNPVLWKKILEAENSILVDVRALNEIPIIQSHPFKSIPLAELESNLILLEPHENIIFVCQSGYRSREAMIQTKKIFPHKNIYALPFGVETLNKLYYVDT